MGQWKARVALFGMVLLLLLITATVYSINLAKRRNSGFLPIAYGFFCIMQFIPMIEALMIGGKYLYNAFFHVVVFVIGIISILLLSKLQRHKT